MVHVIHKGLTICRAATSEGTLITNKAGRMKLKINLMGIAQETS
jgi:hypothetical protein